MDPVTIATGLKLGNGAYQALSKASSGGKTGLRRLRLAGIVDVKWLALGTAQDGLTAPQVENLAEFLRSARVKPLLSFTALVAMLPETSQKAELLVGARESFLLECERWNIDHSSSWNSNSPSVWERVIGLYAGALPIEGSSPDDIAEELELFSSFLSNPLNYEGSRTSATAFVTRLLALSSDLDRLARAAETALSLVDQIKSSLISQSMFTHSQSEHYSDFRKLYVSRTFIDLDSLQNYPSDMLISSGSPFRVVIVGTPGAGKSTFVKHLVAASTDTDLRNPSIGALIVKCREYASSGWAGSIQDYARNNCAAELSLPLSEQAFDDLLLLGKATVVFDGLDEVMDQPKRTEIVRRIHAFAARYPATSMLVTSREVGYERAPLHSGVFKHLRIEEFSESQTAEYCDRWFSLTDRPELRDSFINDSNSIPDLRVNPLLLSLLCVLYREHGAIPLNRRDIYAQCANLLFHRWDSHRQIRQDESMPKYGDRLMQEVARWFYSSSSAQGGLDETVIGKVISNYMRDTLGIDPDEAFVSAADFLEFCAGRAWLLGRVGTTPGGVRVFNFTHRTFYEYFAAESFSRTLPSPSDISRRIAEAYDADPTSVLPELLIQAHDAAHDRGAASVFDHLCAQRADSVLLLRLMEGTILPPFARRPAFELVLQRYTAVGLPPEACTSLFALTSGARKHFVDEFVNSDARSDARRLAVDAWSSLQLSGTWPQYAVDRWQPLINDLLISRGGEISKYSSSAITNWLAIQNRPGASMRSSWEFLVCESMYGWVPGAVWWLLDGIFARGFEILVSHRLFAVAGQMRSAALLSGIPSDVLDRLGACLDALAIEQQDWDLSRGNRGRALTSSRELLLMTVLGLVERGCMSMATAEAVARHWPGGLDRVVSARRAGVANLDRQGRARLDEALRRCPPFVESWVDGHLNLCSPA